MPFTRRRLISRAARASGAAVAASAVPLQLTAPARAADRVVEPWPPLRLPSPPLSDADYFALADDVARRLDRTWVEEEQA